MMYDDWAYRTNEVESLPVAPPAAPKGNRARSHSLLQKVATTSHAPAKNMVPSEPTVRRRARSVIGSPRSRGGLEKHSITVPFTKEERELVTELDSLLNECEPYIRFADSWTDPRQFQLNRAQIKPYEIFRDSSRLHSRACAELLTQADQVVEYLDELAQGFRDVSLQTSEFEAACDSLLSEQNHLAQLHKDVEANLEIFSTLEKTIRKLNSPGSDLPAKAAFKPMLADLDKGLAYTQKYPNFPDMDLYLMRYRQCMTRALTLAHDFFINRIRLMARNVQDKVTANKGLNPTAHSALLYAGFETDTSLLREVGSQISARSSLNKEYEALYDECIRTYFGLRQRLLQPIITRNFEETTKDTRSGFIQLCLASLSFFKDLYVQEFRLFEKFFDAPTNVFENWLGDLSEPLYDSLREKILRQSSVDQLAELTTLLLSQGTDDDELAASSPVGERHDTETHQEPLRIGHLLAPVLEDVQSRLVFRVQSVVEQDIVRYVPRLEDLSELGHRKKSVALADLPDGGESGKIENFSSATILSGLYPPMRLAVTLLSQIYQLVNSRVFDDLAHRIVHESLSSLQRVRTLAVARLGPLESELFVMKNLLMLRTQVIEFDIDDIPAEVQLDFSALQEVLATIRLEGVSFTSEGLLNLARATVPKVVNNMLDAKQELYAELKNSIQDFTEQAVKIVTQPILPQDPGTALEDTRLMRQTATTELPRIRAMISRYISDGRTIDILMDSIQDLTIQTYEEYHKTIVAAARSPEILDGLMEPDGLMSWIGEIVGRLHAHSARESVSGSVSEFSTQ